MAQARGATLVAGTTFERDIAFEDMDSYGTWTALVDYGDGSAPEIFGVTPPGFSIEHVYTQPGTQAGSVTITDSAGAWARYTFEVTATPATVTVSPGPGRLLPWGSPFLQGGTFSYPAGASWTATVDYDDASSPSTLQLSPPSFSLSHEYAHAGVHHVFVEVCRVGGPCGSAIVKVTVLPPGDGSVAADFAVEDGPHEVGRATLFENLSSPDDGSLSFLWTFDDGEGGSELRDPVWVFSQPGVYDVCLVASNESDADMRCRSVTVTMVQPKAAFAIDGLPREGTPLQLTDQSFEGSAPIADWDWDFGGEPHSTVPSPLHTYTTDGGYSICLTVRHAGGVWSPTRCKDIVVENVAPSLAPTGPYGVPIWTPAGVPITLSANESDPGGDVQTPEWDLDDDGVYETAGASVQFTSTMQTRHSVRVRVRDDDGASATAVVAVSVGQADRPLARISGPLNAVEGEYFRLDASASTDPNNVPLTGFAWELDGDGQFDDASGALSYVLAPDDGSMQIAVRVTNAYGQSSEATATVVVANRAPYLTLASPRTVYEGTPLVLRLSAVDVPADAVEADILWGDGASTLDVALGLGGGAALPAHVYADEGARTITVAVHDDVPASASAELSVTVLNAPPAIDGLPASAIAVAGVAWTEEATATDPGADDDLTATIDYGEGPPEVVQVPSSGLVPLSHSFTVAGVFVVSVEVADEDGGSDVEIVLLSVDPPPGDTTPPVWDTGVLTVNVTSPTTVTLSWPAADGTTAGYLLRQDDGAPVRLSASTTSYAVSGLEPGSEHAWEVIAGDSAGNWTAPGVRAGARTWMATPEVTAPAYDGTVIPELADALRFLYEGSDPVIVGLDAAQLVPERVSGVRGSVRDLTGLPLSGARVSVVGHPELGATGSRQDGRFDLVANGGGQITIAVELAGHLAVQRSVRTSWNEWTELTPIVLTPIDPNPGRIVLTSTTGRRTVQSAEVTDPDVGGSTRRSTLFVRPETQVSLTIPGKPDLSATALNLRVTEYTRREAIGIAAMPGNLPRQTAYTFAAEVSADEATAVGATEIHFAPKAVFYTENWRNFAVGTTVPVGGYDTERGVWVPDENGIVIRVLPRQGDSPAGIDLDGNNLAEPLSALVPYRIDDAERLALAELYPQGKDLWRVERAHFSPLDLNYPPLFPEDAIPPNGGPPSGEAPIDSATQCGSIIGVEGQTLGEVVPIIGTPFDLHYQSDRQPAYLAQNTIDVPLTGDTVPNSLNDRNLGRIFVEAIIAGRQITQEHFPPFTPHQRSSIAWDGKDAFGRHVSGAQVARVRVGYIYPASYKLGPLSVARSFGRAGGGGGGGGGVSLGSMDIGGMRSEVVWTEWQVGVGHLLADSLGLGGFTLSAHHVYDAKARRLYRGDGSTSHVEAMGPVVTHVAGAGRVTTSSGDGGPAADANLIGVYGLAVGPDGSIYFTEDAETSHRLRKIGPDGVIRTLAGGSTACPGGACGDGLRAGDPNIGLASPRGIALAADGTIYIAEEESHRVRRIAPDGLVSTFAGGLGPCYVGAGSCGEDGDVHDVSLARPHGVAVGPDGSVYIADTGNARVLQVTPDGKISRLAGTGTHPTPSQACQAFNPSARETPIDARSVIVGPDGDVYISSGEVLGYPGSCVLHVLADGRILRLAGTGGEEGFSGDGGVAWQAKIYLQTVAGGDVGGIAAGRTGGYIADLGNHRIRKVTMDGVIRTIAGTGTRGNSDDGVPAVNASLDRPVAVAEGPDGSVYVVERLDANGVGSRILRISPPPATTSNTDILVPSEDGREVYIFDESRRHKETRDAVTGATRYTFDYDASGRLREIDDRSRGPTAALRRTTIDRSASGLITITAPYGQTTTLELNAEGRLEVARDVMGHERSFTYHPSGLMASMHHPRPGPEHVSYFEYDDRGRLISDRQPGTNQPIELEPDPPTSSGYAVAFESPMGRITRYEVKKDPALADHRVTTAPGGQTQVVKTQLDGSEETKVYAAPPAAGTDPYEIRTVTEYGPDPRFGMRAPLVKRSETTIPLGGGQPPLVREVTSTREVKLANPEDPLSLERIVDRTTINGRTWTEDYDATARTLTTRSPMGRTTVTTFDPQGRVVRTGYPGRAPTHFRYDTEGRLDRVQHGALRQDLTYDDLGYLNGVSNRLQALTMVRRDDGSLESTTLAGETTTFGYDEAGNTNSITPPDRPEHRFELTPRGLTSRYIPPTVGAEDHSVYASYNDDGQQTNLITPDESATYGYNGGSGVLQSIDVTGTPSSQTQLTYNPTTKRLDSITRSGDVGVNMSYQGALLDTVTWSYPVNGSVSVRYNDDLQIRQLQVGGQPAVTYAYDDDGLLTSVTSPVAGTLSLTRDPVDGALVRADFGNIHEVWNYRWDGQLESNRIEGLLETTYRRDELGRITELRETENGQSVAYRYGYDEAGRLKLVDEKRWTGATEPSEWSSVAEYRYDGNGNRLYEITPTSVATAEYDNQDRLKTYTKDGITSTYTYSDRGTLERVVRSPAPSGIDEWTNYEYDAFGNLTRVETENQIIDYLIDASNRRVGKKVNGQLQKTWIYRIYQDALEPVFEIDHVNGWQTQYIYASKSHTPSAMVRNGTTYYIHSDHLGSVRRVLSQSGGVLQQTDYDSWGNILPTSDGVQLPAFGFAGGITDSGDASIRFGARDYAPAIGRWLARDPILFGGRQTIK